jgi:hypothetical protein
MALVTIIADARVDTVEEVALTIITPAYSAVLDDHIW